jgi:hypothetical protein
MRYSILIFLLCLLIVVPAMAKLATDPGYSVAVTIPVYVNPGIAYCGGDYAATPSGMGMLNVDSFPAGSSVNVDGAVWTRKQCIAGYPPVCIPIPVKTPGSGQLDTGSHSVKISMTGYQDYVGNINICSQKNTYVNISLVPVTPVPTTVVPTTTAVTSAPVVTTTVTTAMTTTSATTAPVTILTTTTPGVTAAVVPGSGTITTAAPAGSGSLSITTTPAGASVSIDGVQRGISPANIPGLSAGTHIVLLKLDGYQDLSAPVTITAGMMNEFSTGLTKVPATGIVVSGTTAAGAAKTQAPGFEFALAFAALGAILALRRLS